MRTKRISFLKVCSISCVKESVPTNKMFLPLSLSRNAVIAVSGTAFPFFSTVTFVIVKNGEKNIM